MRARRDYVRHHRSADGGLQQVHSVLSASGGNVQRGAVEVELPHEGVAWGRIPWTKKPASELANLAAICERYGGGGHARVGAISFPVEREADARMAAKEIVRSSVELQERPRGAYCLGLVAQRVMSLKMTKTAKHDEADEGDLVDALLDG